MSAKHELLWFVQGPSYGLQKAYHRGGTQYSVPKFKAVGTLGIDLFASMSAAMKIAEANLTRMAADAGVSPSELSDRLRAERLREACVTALTEQRVTVSPFIALGSKGI